MGAARFDLAALAFVELTEHSRRSTTSPTAHAKPALMAEGLTDRGTAERLSGHPHRRDPNPPHPPDASTPRRRGEQPPRSRRAHLPQRLNAKPPDRRLGPWLGARHVCARSPRRRRSADLTRAVAPRRARPEHGGRRWPRACFCTSPAREPTTVPFVDRGSRSEAGIAIALAANGIGQSPCEPTVAGLSASRKRRPGSSARNRVGSSTTGGTWLLQ